MVGVAESTDPLREQVAHGQQLRDELLRLLLQRTVYATAVALSDRLLPLFAARERAAAEKALREAARLMARVPAEDQESLSAIDWLTARADTVRAQLEGDGA